MDTLEMTGVRAVRENPYTPHSAVAPGLFVGRAREIDILVGHVTSLQRGNVAICGPLGAGKTSLLSYVASPGVMASRGAGPAQPAMIYLDAHSVAPFSITRFWRRVAHLALRTGLEALAAPAARLVDAEEIDVFDVEEFLDDIADRSAAIVLMLDEFEWVLQGSEGAEGAGAQTGRNFLAQLASVARRTPRVLSLVVATEKPLVEVFRSVEAWRGSPFPTVFTALTLGPLDEAACDKLLSVASSFGVDFTPAERELALRASQRHPAFLQAAAFTLFAARIAGVQADDLEALVFDAVAEFEASQRVEEADDADRAERATDRASIGSGSWPASGLWIDADSGEVRVDGRVVNSLTTLEFNLLRLLYEEPGRLCSKERIVESVWGPDAADDVDVSRVEKLVSRLRRKIEPIPGRPIYVRTVRGRGYRYSPGG